MNVDYSQLHFAVFIRLVVFAGFSLSYMRTSDGMTWMFYEVIYFVHYMCLVNYPFRACSVCRILQNFGDCT